MGSEAQIVGLIVSLMSWGAVTVIACLARSARVRRQFLHPGAIRLFVAALWLMSLSAVYSASAFLWTSTAPQFVLDALRFAQSGLRTVVLILILSIAAFFLRLFRS